MESVRIRKALGSGASLEKVRELTGIAKPASLRLMMDRFASPVGFKRDVVTDTALRGHFQIELERNGRWRFKGSFRATGLYSFQVSIVVRVVGTAGVILYFSAGRRVHGTNESGDREAPYEQSGINGLIQANWPDLKNAVVHYDVQYDRSYLGDAGSVLAFAAKAYAAALTAGTTGVLIFASVEALGPENLTALAIPGTVGVLLAGGTVLVFGPGALIPAVVAGVAAGVVTAELVKQRPPVDLEWAFCESVFGRTIPRERVMLTNLVGIGNRPFTCPGPAETILVNLGEGFFDPVNYRGFGDPANSNTQASGQLFIHELAHAWQIAHAEFIPGLMCRGILNQVGTLGGNMDVYKYGPAGGRWGDFNLEQQGKIVDEWFAGNGQQRGAMPKETDESKNGYWRYIRDNIRSRVS
jgi:hypothetical protein